MTKGVPIEGAALLAREFGDQLVKAGMTGEPILDAAGLETARKFLFDPGISVVRDAQIAMRAGRVHAMHDPTEGGLAGALWELADASRHRLVIDPRTVPVPPLAQRICDAFDADPLATIASGALLLAVHAEDSKAIQAALQAEGSPALRSVRWKTAQTEYGKQTVKFSLARREMKLPGYLRKPEETSARLTHP